MSAQESPQVCLPFELLRRCLRQDWQQMRFQECGGLWVTNGDWMALSDGRSPEMESLHVPSGIAGVMAECSQQRPIEMVGLGLDADTDDQLFVLFADDAGPVAIDIAYEPILSGLATYRVSVPTQTQINPVWHTVFPSCRDSIAGYLGGQLVAVVMSRFPG